MGHGKRGGKKRNGHVTPQAQQRRNQRWMNKKETNDMLRELGLA